jgi:hypothetical protein
MEPYWANLVYGAGPTAPILCTWNPFLSNGAVSAWKNATTDAAANQELEEASN